MLIPTPKEWDTENGAASKAEIRDLVRMVRPRRILETGTFYGTGTTATIGDALKELHIDADFRSIEVHPDHHTIATKKVAAAGLPVKLLHGLSIPIELLPSRERIAADLSDLNEWGPAIYVDYDERYRVKDYFGETHFPQAADDLIGKTLKEWEGRCDLVVLDSAGHLGYREFCHLMSLLACPCWLVLEDVRHVKHVRSLETVRQDSHFRIAKVSDDKFGFAIAHYEP